MTKDVFHRSDTWINNQLLSKKMYEELCDMKGIHPYGGEQRCPTCKKRTRWRDKQQGLYSFAVNCVACKTTISPLSTTIFGHTKTHLSVWFKAAYILKVKEPTIMVKDLAATLNVSLDTARNMRVKITALRKNAFELRALERLVPMLKEHFYFIFNENPKQHPL